MSALKPVYTPVGTLDNNNKTYASGGNVAFGAAKSGGKVDPAKRDTYSAKDIMIDHTGDDGTVSNFCRPDLCCFRQNSRPLGRGTE